MKKGWIITLIFVFVVCVFQQSMVYSASCNATCSDSKRDEGRDKLYYPNPDRFNNYLLCTGGNWEDWCCACYEDNEPMICDSTLTCPDPRVSISPTITPTPSTTTPTNTPTPAPIDCQWSSWSTCYNAANCGTGTQIRYPSPPASNGGTQCTGSSSQSCSLNPCPINCEWNDYGPCSRVCGEGTKTRTIKIPAAYGGASCTGSTTTTCINRLCSDVGSTGGVIIIASSNQDSLSVESRTLPTPTRAPTPTPELVRFNTIDYYLQAFRQPTPTKAPIPTLVPTIAHIINDPAVIPTITQVIPTPTLRPESIIPGSLAAQTHTLGKTSFTLNTGSISEIRIAPNPVINTNTAPEKPFLPQEQKLLAQNVGMSSGGIMVTLQQKTGSQFVTRQDELTVKRGNQFFSISNQNIAPITKTVQTSQVNTSNSTNTSQQPSLKLEINANNVIAQSSMALSVDPLSGILIVETPNGPQKVSIMPDEALGIILELRALNSGIPDPSILLVSENGKLIYRISGAKMEKFIGLLPIAIQKQILVSADTGSIVKVELSLISSILSFFTF